MSRVCIGCDRRCWQGGEVVPELEIYICDTCLAAEARFCECGRLRVCGLCPACASAACTRALGALWGKSKRIV
jgi:hypothetical protein